MERTTERMNEGTYIYTASIVKKQLVVMLQQVQWYMYL